MGDTIDHKWLRHSLVCRQETGLFRVISVLKIVNILLEEGGCKISKCRNQIRAGAAGKDLLSHLVRIY